MLHRDMGHIFRQPFSPNGFSLLELLVVVAIIGALAAIGVIVYADYTASVRAETTKAHSREAAYVFQIDRFGAGNGINVGLADNLTCKDYVGDKVNDLNDTVGKNLFDPTDMLPYFHGNVAATAAEWNSGANSVSRDNATNRLTFPAGKVLVYCSDPENQFKNSRVISCACDELDGWCETDGSWDDFRTANPGFDFARDAMPNAVPLCPHPNS